MLHRPGVTQNLARFVVETRWDDIPEPVRHEAKRALLNFFAVALAGCRAGPVEIALKSLAEFSDRRQATVIGRSERIDALSAAFLNAAGANVFDFCDTHLPTVIHPTAPVAPALFALAELRRVTGRRPAAGLHSRRRDAMPDRPRHLARPLRQGLAHHLDLRRVRRRHRRRQAASASTQQRMVWALGNASTQSSRPVRMPGLAGQEHQRRQCRAQRPVVGAARREGLRGPGRADRRRARLPQRDGGAAELVVPHRRLGRDLGDRAKLDQALSLRLRDPSVSRLRAGLAARAPDRRGRARGRCAAIRCSATAPTGPTSRPAASRRSACSMRSPPRWYSDGRGSINSPTPARAIRR